MKKIINITITTSVWLIILTYFNLYSTIVQLVIIMTIAFLTSALIDRVEIRIKRDRQNIVILSRIDEAMTDFDKTQANYERLYKKVGLKSN